MTRRLPKVVTVADLWGIATIGCIVGFALFAFPAYVLAVLAYVGSEGHSPDRSTSAFWVGGAVGALSFGSAALAWAVRDRRRP